MISRRVSRRAMLALSVAGLTVLAACGRGDATSASETASAGDDAGAVVIGASLPLTGPLQAFGTSLQLGYQRAVDEVNEAGGLDIGGQQRQVELAVRDNASDGTQAAAQAKQLVLEDGAIALLGPATPPLTIPMSVAAEQLQVPLISTITPVLAWAGANEDGWTWAWDVFFDETQMTSTQFQAADLVATNKKVALFTDQEEDGVVMGGLWEQNAPAAGYEIVYRAEFPVGNTNFASQVQAAREAGADILIGQVIPPDGVSLLREMKAQEWQPALVFLEKAGNTGGYPQISEGLAEGVLAANWFAEGMGLPEEADFISTYGEQIGGVNSDLGCLVYGYSISTILLEAVAAAGSTDAVAINEAIGATDGEYPAGAISFDDRQAAVLPAVQTQWSGKDMVLVTDADGNGVATIATPTPGLG